jgi:hypothetical protein
MHAQKSVPGACQTASPRSLECERKFNEDKTSVGYVKRQTTSIDDKQPTLMIDETLRAVVVDTRTPKNLFPAPAKRHRTGDDTNNLSPSLECKRKFNEDKTSVGYVKRQTTSIDDKQPTLMIDEALINGIVVETIDEEAEHVNKNQKIDMSNEIFVETIYEEADLDEDDRKSRRLEEENERVLEGIAREARE